MKRWLPWALLGVACERRLDLRVDASAYAAVSESTALVVEVVAGGETQHRRVFDLARSAEGVIEDAVVVSATHGVVAFGDVDGDGACDPAVDDGWSFVIQAGAQGPLVWTVTRDDFRDQNACVWFSGVGIDLDDLDDTDAAR